jgi:hypothetical protein
MHGPKADGEIADIGVPVIEVIGHENQRARLRHVILPDHVQAHQQPADQWQREGDLRPIEGRKVVAREPGCFGHDVDRAPHGSR